MAYLRKFTQLNGILVLIILSAFDITAARNVSRVSFAAVLFETIREHKPNENVIFSPISIESCVLLAFFGASGQTAEEMRVGLRLGTEPRAVVATKYGSFLRHAFQNSTKGTQRKMLSRIYLNEGLEAEPDFSALAAEVFGTRVEHVNFAESKATASEINTWVSQQTQQQIKNLILADDINALTVAVLVNAIYFKGDWARSFSVSNTHKSDFLLNEQQTVSIDMMQNKGFYNYAELPDFDATALEMPYANSKISMLLVLPNKVEGLQALERLLSLVALSKLMSYLKRQEVKVFLPKFRIEFEVDLKQVLPKLGMEAMFSHEANFSRMLTTGGHMTISHALQKAYLDVDETGSEAAAATLIRMSTRSLRPRPVYFRADHPFFFAILSSRAVYFIGHLTKF